MQFEDPNRDWTTDENRKGHSFLAYLEFPEFVRNAELRIDYDYRKYNGLYLCQPGPAYIPSPSEPGGIGQLPAVTSDEHRLSMDLRYFLCHNVAIGFAYWYDDYDVSDFTLGPPGESFSSGIAQPAIFEDQPAESAINSIVLNYFYRPHTSHTGWMRLTYLLQVTSRAAAARRRHALEASSSPAEANSSRGDLFSTAVARRTASPGTITGFQGVVV